MNKTIFIAAILAVTTVLAAVLTVLPSTVQEAQANPCATEVEQDVEADEDSTSSAENILDSSSSADERECTFIGPVDIDED